MTRAKARCGEARRAVPALHAVAPMGLISAALLCPGAHADWLLTFAPLGLKRAGEDERISDVSEFVQRKQGGFEIAAIAGHEETDDVFEHDERGFCAARVL